MVETLGRAGINIDGCCGFPCEGKEVIHVLLADAAAARSAIQEAGFEVSYEREVLMVEVEDRPDGLGQISRRIAGAGVNIDLLYLSAGGHLVFGVDDMEKARAAI